jgi:uncharacterized protein (DUF486 family)
LNPKMIKCPRCNLPQDESPQCEYCGLIFKEFVESSRTSKTVDHIRTVLFVIILLAAGVFLTFIWFNSSQQKSGEKSAISAGSSVKAQGTEEDKLWTTAKELSGNVGIMDSLAGGSTKGSIIAMVVFSIIGIGYFTYGKKSHQLLMVVCGIALMVYSYFVKGTVHIVLAGAGLSALPFILGRK